MAQIKPLGDRVLVKRSKAQTSKMGILLPDSAQEKPKEGEILAVGPGKINDQGKLEPSPLKPGHKVLFSAYGGTEVKAPNDNEVYLILGSEEVLGIIET